MVLNIEVALGVAVLLAALHCLKKYSLQARIEKKLDEELPQEWIGGMKLGPKVSGNQGLSKS